MTAMKVKQFSGTLLFFLFYCVCYAQTVTSIIPLPNNITWGKDSFSFSPCTHLVWDNKNAALKDALYPLVMKIKTAAGLICYHQVTVARIR